MGGLANASTWYVESVLPGRFPAILVNDGGFGIRTNCFGFNVRSSPGLVVVVDASTNLATWVPVQTNVTPDLGQCSFADPNWSQSPRRFYRVRAQ